MSTLKEVARRAGVSASTVSRVLSKKLHVDEKTEQRVMRAIEELNYHPNPLARALREKRSYILALVVPGIENQIWPLVARGVERIARRHNYSVLLCNTDNDVNLEKQSFVRLRQQWVDGIIVAPAKDTGPHILSAVQEGFPLVQVIRGLEDKRIDAVMVDNFRIAYAAVEYLYKTGHRHIAIASGQQELNIYRQRLTGYKQAIADFGLPADDSLVFQEIKELNNLYRLTQQKIRDGVTVDAIVATSDPKAIVVMRALRDVGLSIPHDISVIGIDNIEQSFYVEPPLTTLAQPFVEMGELAAQKLIFHINHPDDYTPATDLLNFELIIRRSTR